MLYGAPKNCRNLDFRSDVDDTGRVVSEVFKIRNWAVVSKPATSVLNGKCTVTIHLYRTQSKCLINGNDAWAMIDLLIPALEAHLNTQKTQVRH